MAALGGPMSSPCTIPNSPHTAELPRVNDSWWLRLGAKPALAAPLAVRRAGSSALPAVASRTRTRAAAPASPPRLAWPRGPGP
eukprot:4532051-Prymnesium_polylepis.2